MSAWQMCMMQMPKTLPWARINVLQQCDGAPLGTYRFSGPLLFPLMENRHCFTSRHSLVVRLSMRRKPSLVASFRQLPLGRCDAVLTRRQSGASADGSASTCGNWRVGNGTLMSRLSLQACHGERVAFCEGGNNAPLSTQGLKTTRFVLVEPLKLRPHNINCVFSLATAATSTSNISDGRVGLETVQLKMKKYRTPFLVKMANYILVMLGGKRTFLIEVAERLMMS